MTADHILLLDMDGVLVQPGAYHQALQETVRLIGLGLGFATVELTPAEIAAFEASDVYSEWDTSAICAALLLREAWQVDPRRTLPEALDGRPGGTFRLLPPDFSAFARRMAPPDGQPTLPLELAERLLLGDAPSLDDWQRGQLHQILRGARDAWRSPIHRAFQELVLGSELYHQTYPFPALLHTPSFLLSRDRPLLDAEQRRRLLAWLEQPSHGAAIFTSRPSTPPPGSFNTPEAELGARLVGLENLPVAGLGGLRALEQRRRLPLQSTLKPSPVHALVAILLADGTPAGIALTASADLVCQGQFQPRFASLAGRRVSVFEDTVNGLRSALAATDLLARHGIRLHLDLYGIAHEPEKVQALRQMGAQVYNSIGAALGDVLGEAGSG